MKKILLLFALLSFVAVNHFAKSYKGAELRTKESFLYGRFEASFKACGKEGTLSTMFTYFDGTATDPWEASKWNEIDIEILGRYNNDVQFNTITSGATNHVRHQYVNFNPALDYHTYAFEWTPDYIAWFIDGVEVYRQTQDFIKTVTRAQKLMFNVWLPNYPDWVGAFTEQILPAFTFYDWTAYYAYTPGKGNYGTGNNFTFNWRDDFNSFDSNRWEKATHTWSGNNSDMEPANINYKDGKMILSLTNSVDLGMIDKKAPTVLTVRAISENKVRVFFSEEIEKSSAEISTKYIIANHPDTKKATLLSDLRTVELDVENLNLTSLPNIIVMSGIKDLASPVNSSSVLSRSIIAPLQFKFPIKINIGGNENSNFLADREFKTDTANYGYMEGTRVSVSDNINNTNDDAVFQTGVINPAKYVVRVPNGKYKVRLLFSENYLTQIGARTFDVYVQGVKAIQSLDIYKEAGSKTALEKVIDNVEVTNYLLDVHFAALVNNPIICGIIIEQTGTSVNEQTNIPSGFYLEQNYPNPFNPTTAIRYKVQVASHVTLKVYDVLGNEVATLVDELKTAGKHFTNLNVKTRHGASLQSGVYFYRIKAGSFSDTKKMLLLK